MNSEIKILLSNTTIWLVDDFINKPKKLPNKKQIQNILKKIVIE